MKSISQKISIMTSIMMIVSLMLFGTYSIMSNINSTKAAVESSFTETALVAADRVAWELKSYINIAAEMGSVPELSDDSVSAERKKEIIDSRLEYYNLVAGTVVAANGDSIDGNNYSEREHFQAAMRGETYVSSPTVSKLTGKLTIIIAAPLWADGKAGGEVAGCVFVVPDEEFLNDIVRNVKMSANGSSYILNGKGTTIADEDTENVKNEENVIELGKSDPNYADEAAVAEKMINGESGFSIFEDGSGRNYIAYAPVSGTDGWSLAVWSPNTDYLEKTYSDIVVLIIILVIMAVIATVIAILFGKKIGGAVNVCTERMEKLAKGDLKSSIPEINSKDETGRLSAAAKAVITDLNNMISDIGRILEAMASGNLSVDTSMGEKFYVGDFEQLLGFVRDINSKLNDTMAHINVSADQVSSGSEQVASGAQALAQGATEQASEIETLASRVRNISDDVSENSKNCTEASNIVAETVRYIELSIDKMNNLNDAMHSISTTSEQIEHIIKTIEDIAFQTNILALNAAVEAARAGSAGKGFAVVADEVRNLATKSSEAAQSTSTLIQQSIEAVKNGTSIAAETTEAIAGVGKRSADVEAIVSKIAEASEKQADMVDQVTTGIEHISSVVQTNSATAEESAAASEELSGQSNMLKQLVGEFVLK